MPHRHISSVLSLLAAALPTVAALSFTQVECVAQCAPTLGSTNLQARPTFTITNGLVRSSGMWDQDGPGGIPAKLVVGGEFSAGIYIVDPLTGLSTGYSASAAVDAITTLPNGDLVVGGVFTTIGGVAANRIARFDGTTWWPMGVGFDNDVYALAVMPNGDLVAGGAFSQAGGGLASRIARWDGTTWHQLGLGMDPAITSAVYSLAAQPNGDLAVGGTFLSAGGVAASRIAVWNGAWSAMGLGANDAVYSVKVNPTGGLVAGGIFTSIDGVPCNRVASWDGTTWSPMSNGFDNMVYTMTYLPNGGLLAGGAFTQAGFQPASRVALWNGFAWLPLGAGVDDVVLALTPMPSGGVFAGGAFLNAAGNSFPYAARWNGSAWAGVGDGFNGAVKAVATKSNGDIVVGGSFTSAGGLLANRIALGHGSTWSTLGAGFDGSVKAIAVMPNGDIVAGGSFTTTGGIPVGNIARWDGMAWSPLGSLGGLNDEVRCLRVMPNGNLLVGGAFTSAGGAPAGRVARWDGSAWHALGIGCDAPVNALHVMPDGSFVAGGEFANVDGIPASYVARWTGSSWIPLGLGGSAIPRPVLSLAHLRDGRLVAGIDAPPAGLGGPVAVQLWSGSGWSSFGFTQGRGDALILLPNGDLVAAVNSTAFVNRGLWRWSEGGWSQFTTPVSIFGSHTAVAIARQPFDDALIVVGGFADLPFSFVFDGLLVARISTNCQATSVPYGTGCRNPIFPLALTANSLPWTGSTVVANASALAPNALGVGLIGLSTQNIPLSSINPVGGPGCDLLVTADSVQILFPTAGTASLSFAIPSDPIFSGVVVNEQVLEFEVGVLGNLAALRSTNALRLTVGSF